MVDRLHITYRIRVREEGVLKMVEQEAYCVVGDGLITEMRTPLLGLQTGDYCLSGPVRTQHPFKEARATSADLFD